MTQSPSPTRTLTPKKLTDSYIRAAKSTDKPYKLKPREDGLYLQVTPGGGKWWRLAYSFGGKEKLLSLGTYPEISLADARARRDEARKLLAKGIDPSVQRKADKAESAERAENTFELVARDWLGIKADEWVPAHLNKETLRLTKHVFPYIGQRPMADIGVDDYLSVIQRVLRGDHVENAHRLREQLGRISRYAVAKGLAKTDPAHALSEALPARRERGFPAVVKADAIGGLLRAMEGHKGTFIVRCALRLAPYLFCRPAELRTMEWTHLRDLDGERPEYHIPPTNRKLLRAKKTAPDAEPHIVPLPPQAVAILKELHQLTGQRQYVFPGARDPKRCMSEAAINAALATLGYKGQMVGHGFRHMASTRLEELGWNPDVIEAQLSHKVAGVKGKYKRDQHLRFLEQRHSMLRQWANYLDELKRGDRPSLAAAA